MKYLYRVEILQGWCAAKTTHFDNSYDVTIATYSLPDLYLPKIKKMPYLLIHSLTDFLELMPCNVHISSHPNVHISSHPLNKQPEQITLLEGENSDFIFWMERAWREPIVLPWKCHSGNIMKLCGECNNCTKFHFYTKKVLPDIPFFVILQHFVSTMWRHKSSWKTWQPKVLSQ